MMKRKGVLLGLLMLCLITANAKCNWGIIQIRQWNQLNKYRWTITGDKLNDPCIRYEFTAVNDQNIHVDTVYSNSGIYELETSKKGNYKIYLKVLNHCEECDTTLFQEINVNKNINPNFYVNYWLLSTTGPFGWCLDSVFSVMNHGPWRVDDTCFQWYTYLWKGSKLDSLTVSKFQTMKDSAMLIYFDFHDSDLLIKKGPGMEAFVVGYKFQNKGNYLISFQWYDKCSNQNTFGMGRINIDKCIALGASDLVKPEPKLIGMYDMMGRPVKHMRKDEVIILIYDDGSKKKIISQSW
jgi:hypothetical protein